MSKYVKDLMTTGVRDRLSGVNDALLVSVAGLSANKNFKLRRELRGKKINLLVVKNSLARRAVEGSSLAAGFEGLTGLTAVVWGEQDIVSLAKEIIRLTKDKQYAGIIGRGGVLDGVKISPAEVEQVSNWPTRGEQLSLVVGMILSPGARLSSQLISGGGALASQIKEHAEKLSGAEGAPAETPAEGAAAEAAPAEPVASSDAAPANPVPPSEAAPT